MFLHWTYLWRWLSCLDFYAGLIEGLLLQCPLDLVDSSRSNRARNHVQLGGEIVDRIRQHVDFLIRPLWRRTSRRLELFCQVSKSLECVSGRGKDLANPLTVASASVHYSDHWKPKIILKMSKTGVFIFLFAQSFVNKAIVRKRNCAFLATFLLFDIIKIREIKPAKSFHRILLIFQFCHKKSWKYANQKINSAHCDFTDFLIFQKKLINLRILNIKAELYYFIEREHYQFYWHLLSDISIYI